MTKEGLCQLANFLTDDRRVTQVEIDHYRQELHVHTIVNRIITVYLNGDNNGAALKDAVKCLEAGGFYEI